MRAVVASGPGRFAVADVPTPELPAGGVVVEVEAAGVCAADRMLWTGDHPWGALPWPFTPGHELLGRVVASDRDDVPTGTRVTAEVGLPCGSCRACLRGRSNLCREAVHLGSAAVPGAFAERTALPARAVLHRVPDDLPTERAVLAEPAACALHAVRRGSVGPGDVVAVVGLGAVGALAVAAARAEGAARVCVVTRSAEKARVAADVLDADSLDDLDAPPDVVVECSGDPAAAARALHLVVEGGRVVLYGVYRRPAAVDLNAVAEFKELDVRGGHLAPGAFPDAITRLADLPDGLVTAVRPLEQLRQALEPLEGLRLKEVLVP